MTLMVNVLALNSHHAGFSYVTFSKSDICSNIFNDNPCGYMKNILKVFLDQSEKEKSLFVDEIKNLKEEFELLKKQSSRVINHQKNVPNFSRNWLHSATLYTHKYSPETTDSVKNPEHFLHNYRENSEHILNVDRKGAHGDFLNVSKYFIMGRYFDIGWF